MPRKSKHRSKAPESSDSSQSAPDFHNLSIKSAMSSEASTESREESGTESKSESSYSYYSESESAGAPAATPAPSVTPKPKKTNRVKFAEEPAAPMRGPSEEDLQAISDIKKALMATFFVVVCCVGISSILSIFFIVYGTENAGADEECARTVDVGLSTWSIVYGVAGLVIACMAICVIGIALRTTYVSARNEVLPQREKQSPIPGLLGGLFSYILLSCCGCFLFAWLFVGVALLVQSQDDEPCKAKYADFRQFITITLIIIGVCTVLNCIQSCCRRARKKDDE